MKTIKYHTIFIISLLSGGVTTYCFALGLYELYKCFTWNVLFVPISLIVFVASLLYVSEYRVEPKSEKAKRVKVGENIKKELSNLL